MMTIFIIIMPMTMTTMTMMMKMTKMTMMMIVAERPTLHQGPQWSTGCATQQLSYKYLIVIIIIIIIQSIIINIVNSIIKNIVSTIIIMNIDIIIIIEKNYNESQNIWPKWRGLTSMIISLVARLDIL